MLRIHKKENVILSGFPNFKNRKTYINPYVVTSIKIDLSPYPNR